MAAARKTGAARKKTPAKAEEVWSDERLEALTELRSQIATAVRDGQLDGSIEWLKGVIASREDAIARNLVGSLKPGDKVRLRGMRPKYVNGMTGSVVTTDGEEVLVDVPGLVGTRYRQKTWVKARNLVRYGDHVTIV